MFPLALYTFEQRFHIAPPPAPPLVSERLRLDVEIDGVSAAFTPYVFLDPGRPFSVLSNTIAGHLACASVSISTDPVPFEQWDGTAFAYRPAGAMPVARLTQWQQNPCDFVTTSVRLRDRVSGSLTGPLRLFAHRPRVVVPNFADCFIILGYSFLRDNSAELSVIPRGGSVGRLTV